MFFSILYVEKVVKNDIPSLSRADQKRIRKAVEEKLTEEPDIFGKPLRKSLKGYRSLRVGDHRVFFRIEQQTVKIFATAHRKKVYEEIMKRM